MAMDDIAGSKRLEDFVQSLLVRLKQEEFSPESFRWCQLIDIVVIRQDIEEMQVELDNLRFE